MRTALLVVFVALAGCMPKITRDRIEALEAQNAAVEARLAALEAKPVPSTAAGTDDVAEAKAAALLKQAQDAANAMRFDEARRLLDEIAALGETRAGRSATRLRTELAVVGQPAGALEVDRWLQGYPQPMDDGVTLLVFFEEWCPHCKRELPKLEATYQQWNDRGLNVVALTKLSRSSTEETVRAMITENSLTMPIGVERDSTMSTRFSISGIPAAAIVKDGTVVWRGHPARIDDALLENVLEG